MEFCFELLGFDILVDSSYKPWLIEVNAPPAISIDIPLDQWIKESLVKDTIKLLKFPNPLQEQRQRNFQKESQHQLYFAKKEVKQQLISKNISHNIEQLG